MKRFVFLATMLFALVARPAFATSILVTGNTSFTVNWLNTTTNPDLSATATFTVTNFTTTGFDLKIDQISNTTPTTPNINARMISFGFGLGPNFTSYSNAVNGSTFNWGFSNFPSFGAVDACAYSGSNCAGGGNGGLTPGQSMAGSMTIHFNGPFSNGVTFSPIPVKIQTANGSYEFDGCVVGDTNCDVQYNPNSVAAVPEPASMVLLAPFIFLGAAPLRRPRRKA
jgi:hypothetical protein